MHGFSPISGTLGYMRGEYTCCGIATMTGFSRDLAPGKTRAQRVPKSAKALPSGYNRAMVSDPILPLPTELAVEQWRMRTTRLLLGIVAVTGTVRLLMLVTQWPAGFGVGAGLIVGLLYAWLLMTVFVRQVGHRARLWSFIVLSYALGVFQLVRGGLVGDGRITLIALPLFVLAMAGNMPGWIAMGISAMTYTGVAIAADRGLLRDLLVFHENSTDLSTWAVLAFGGTFHLVLLAGIITGLLNIYRKSLRSERQAAIQLREEASRREAALQALERESRERARLEAALLNAGEEERRLMGAEVHDGLCQQLTAAILNCAVAERRGEQDHGRAIEDIRTARKLLEECVDDAYSLVHRLAPLQMSGKDLSQALSTLAERTRQSAEISCRYREEGDTRRFIPQAGAHLYRIAQEAIRNVIRHAHAKEVVIELSGEAQAIHLRIVDDGAGIDESRPTRSGGMGLGTMRYRAGLIGGELTISRGPTGGTIVACRLPLPAPCPTSEDAEPAKMAERVG